MKNKLLTFFILLLMSFIIGCNKPTTEVFNITNINLETDLIEMTVGENELIPINYDGDGSYNDLIFELDNNIISIDEGIITGVAPGIVNITIKAKNNEDLFVVLTVYVNKENYKSGYVRMDLASNGLIIGNSIPLSIANMEMLLADRLEDFSFTVSDPTILKIDDNYNVTALNNGVCTIYARQISCPSNSGEFTIYVGLQSTDLTSSKEPDNTPLIAYFDDNNYIIDASTDEQINILGANNYERYRFVPEDENILLISDTGKFMGVSEGETKVTILSKDASNNICKTTLRIKVTGNRHRDYVTELLKVALAEEGYTEWTNRNDTKYGEWNTCNYEAWCAIFVSWCLNNAGVPVEIVSRSISVRVYENTYRTKGQFHLKGEYQPQPGDLIIFSSAGASHVGIVVKSDATTVYTIEGNTSNMVAQRSYSLDYEQITGYIHPKYDE